MQVRLTLFAVRLLSALLGEALSGFGNRPRQLAAVEIRVGGVGAVAVTVPCVLGPTPISDE
jgi:hypothetical protein